MLYGRQANWLEKRAHDRDSVPRPRYSGALIHGPPHALSNKVRSIKLICRFQVVLRHWTQSQHPTVFLFPTRVANNLDYMVKPHGQLVLVSSTPHNAYTPSLSTS